MTAEQVLRVAIIKQLNGFSCDELSFDLADSRTYRAFCGFGTLEPTPGLSTLQRNVRSITEETWEAIHCMVLGFAEREGVEDGNLADSTLAIRMLEHQRDIYGRVPRQAAFDGGFASKANLEGGKALGVEDLAFSKKRGLEVLDMARSHWVYRRLRNLRAGIESWISLLNRSFGLERCSWKG